MKSHSSVPDKEKILKNAEILWHYMVLDMPLRKSTCIFVMGSNDLRVADYAAQLYLDGWGDYLVFSGAVGNFTKGVFQKTEAELFADIALEKGVPAEKIFLEKQATNTGENVAFTLNLLKSLSLSPQSWLLVQKPFMERRALATFQKQVPLGKVVVTSPPINFQDYPNDAIPLEALIHTLVGDVQRTCSYHNLGFITKQEVPLQVKIALQELMESGYTQHCLPNLL